jgi:phosphopantothenoylcysteine decarboxylase/phosphopantothenate--cysteine ligase
MESEFAACDACIMAAAVSDYRPERTSDVKLSREQAPTMELRLVANPDILAGLGRAKGSKVLVGFALETGDGMERAREKRARKNCDILVLNHVDSSLGRETSQATILDAAGEVVALDTMDKGALARRILERVARCMGRGHD